MSIKRIIKIKDGIKEARARELKEINMRIEIIKKEIRLLENNADSINEEIKESFSEGLLFQYRALMARKRELTEELRKLKLLKEEKKEKLKQAYRDIKALDIISLNKEKENMAKNLNLESQNLGFMYLIRQRYRNA